MRVRLELEMDSGRICGASVPINPSGSGMNRTGDIIYDVDFINVVAPS